MNNFIFYTWTKKADHSGKMKGENVLNDKEVLERMEQRDAVQALLVDVIKAGHEREKILRVTALACAGVALVASVSALIVAFYK